MRANHVFQLLSILSLAVIGCAEQSTTQESPTLDDGGVSDQYIAPIVKPQARFEIQIPSTSTGLGEIPFPNDLYLNETGHIQIDNFAFNLSGSLVGKLLTALNEHVMGFACAGTHYMSFDGPIDTRLLPQTGADSLAQDSTLYLLDIDTSSPFAGTRYPVRWRFKAEETLYLPANTLSIRPVEGLALRPATTYAMIISSEVADQSTDFSSLLQPTAPSEFEAAWTLYAPIRALGEQSMMWANASVFTTMDPVSEMFQLADYISTYPAPEVQDLNRAGSFPGLYVEYQGTYTAPNFQSGEPPFLTDGGYLEYDQNGDPIVQRLETLRFSMSIPSNSEMPESGWPVVMYGHGTGGDYRSYINSGAAATLARVGIAMVGIDQVHHGPRDTRPNNCAQQSNPSACVSALFFNFINPLAGRDNVRQSAADFVSLARMLRTRVLDVDVEDTDPSPPLEDAIDAGVERDDVDAGAMDEMDEMDTGTDVGTSELDSELEPASVVDAGIAISSDGSLVSDADTAADTGTAEDADGSLRSDSMVEPPTPELVSLRFDPDSLMYLGHSQGGVNGPLFLAVDKNVTAGMLSAAGGNIAITLEQKRRPFDIAGFAEMLVMLGDNDTLDRWHPLFLLVQTFIEPGDPINYARFWFDEPRGDAAPKSIFMTAGLDDEYTPPEAIFSLAASGAVPIIPPIRVPIELNEIRGIQPSGIPPFEGNVANGNAAAGLLQVPNVGHFVFQNDITVRNRYKQFFKSVVDGNPKIF